MLVMHFFSALRVSLVWFHGLCYNAICECHVRASAAHARLEKSPRGHCFYWRSAQQSLPDNVGAVQQPCAHVHALAPDMHACKAVPQACQRQRCAEWSMLRAMLITVHLSRCVHDSNRTAISRV